MWRPLGRLPALLLCLGVLLLAGCGGDTPLTGEEIRAVEALFHEEDGRAFASMLLSSEYAAPGEIDLGWLFREGVPMEGGGWGYPVTAEEVSALQTVMDRDSYQFLLDHDVYKIPCQDMDRLLRSYLGLGVEETAQTGLDRLILLPEYDAYYGSASDTRMVVPDISSGVRREDGTLELRYHQRIMEDGVAQEAADTHVMVLQPTEEGYRFLSNLPIP